MRETVLATGKHYRGCIRWAKLSFDNGKHKVEKRRPFGNQAYWISKEESDWIDTAKKAQAIWFYHHYSGTAAWWGGEVIHPLFGKEWTLQHIENCRADLSNPQPKIGSGHD